MAFDDADWGVGVEEKVNLAPTEEKGEIVIDINSPETITSQLRKGLNNTPTRLGFYDGSVWKSYITSDGKFKFEGDGTNKIEWDGASLNITGSLSINNPSDVRSELNVADGADVTGDNTANNTNNVGNKSSTNVQSSVDKTDSGLNSSGEITQAVKGTLLPVLSPTVAGLYMDSSRMGYHNGTSWTNYMSADGFFRVGNGGNSYIEYNPNTDTTTFTGTLKAGALNIETLNNLNTRSSITYVSEPSSVGNWTKTWYLNCFASDSTTAPSDSYRFNNNIVSNISTFGELTLGQVNLLEVSGSQVTQVAISIRLGTITKHTQTLSFNLTDALSGSTVIGGLQFGYYKEWDGVNTSTIGIRLVPNQFSNMTDITGEGEFNIQMVSSPYNSADSKTILFLHTNI